MQSFCNLMKVVDTYSKELLQVKGTIGPDNICFQKSKGSYKLKLKKAKQYEVLTNSRKMSMRTHWLKNSFHPLGLVHNS